jgi:ParB/RepB/Spo0J family partition protein
MGEIVEVKVKDIIVPPIYIRKELGDIKGLATSIKIGGLGYRIQVDKNLILVDGLRRLESLRKNKVKRAEVEIVDIPDFKRVEYQIMLDVHKKRFNPIELAHALKSYMNENKLSHRDAEERLGISKSTIGYHLKLLDLPKEVQEDIHSGKMKPYAVERLIYKKKIKTVDEFKKKTRVKQMSSIINRISAIKTFVEKADLTFPELERIRQHIGEVLFIIERKSHGSNNKGRVQKK